MVTPKAFEEILRRIDSHLGKSLRMKFCEVLINRYAGEEVYLRTEWKTGGDGWDEPLREGEVYKGQVSYAFAKQRALWIVGEQGAPLEKSERYRDLLTGELVKDLPPYVDLTPSTILTSVIIPLRKPEKFGLVNFEFAAYVRATPAMRRELFSIADAIASLYRLKDLYVLREENTKEAQRILLEKRHHLWRPSVFVAYPAHHDRDVIQAVRDVLNEFQEELEPYFWEDDHTPGGIHNRLSSEILTCQFGVCYFSEIVGSGQQAFRDNPNVLFEAGMLNALGDNPEGTPQTWIPIREFMGDQVPFDFIDQRILFVNRDENGKLAREIFIKTFRSRLCAMLTYQREKLRLLPGGIPSL